MILKNSLTLFSFIILIDFTLGSICPRDRSDCKLPPLKPRDPRCPQLYEVWSNCHNCPLTCRNPTKRYCTSRCKAGCDCLPGYVRKNKTGPCVARRDCVKRPKKCGRHQHWAECPKCQKTCYNLKRDKERCSELCQPRCVCDRGFVRLYADTTGPCVRPNQCRSHRHRRCPKHSHWSRCKAGCDRTCYEPYGDRLCFLICQKGCVCDKNYVRENKDGTGKCIRLHRCPYCPRNERWSTCKARCQPTCHHRHRKCKSKCKSGCICKEGYIRAFKQGPCILRKFCRYY
ncbi:hypothetical protein SSS_10529 [Sarcoptes scabiei]|uniref:TIL domain-containing protein n=1 Tax=Sarcoptes scabiei TaxID=52283 RepID=A0A834V9P8_SARSC|nr:hypothetical protein SSS_10529 [Sarcoptes scabiei]